MIWVFGRGGRVPHEELHESRSPIYIYMYGCRFACRGGFFPTINFIRSAGVVGSGKVLRGNRATSQKKIW